MDIEFFSCNQALAQLEERLQQANPSQRLPLLLALAWQLRQRDTARALVLADEVESLLAESGLAAAAELQAELQAELPAELQAISLRLMLLRAEATWLSGELDASQALADTAGQGFEALGDALGCADAHWLRAWIARDRGNLERTFVELEAMEAAAGKADPVRLTIAQATQARFASFSNVTAAQARWGEQFAAESSTIHPAAAFWINDFWGLVAAQNSDYVESVRITNKAWSLALETGQLRAAVVVATNIGDDFNHLNEYNSALEWMQRALDLARQCGWPNVIGNALKETAETMRLLRQYDTAHDLLREALNLLDSMSGSRSYVMALQYLGEVELDRRRYQSALETFQLLEQRGTLFGHADLLSRALCGKARALFHLAEPQAALQAAKAAQGAAIVKVSDRIAALQIMARIHAHYRLPAPTMVTNTSPPLYYLQQALELANTIQGYLVPPALLDATAQEYANLGDYEQAFYTGKQAGLARERIHSLEAANRASAIQVNYQTEKAWAEAEHLRQLASAQAERAEVLQETSNTLGHLGAIGQEITAHLNADLVFQVLNRHVQHLLEVSSFAIYRISGDAQILHCVFGFEEGKPMPGHSFLLSNSHSETACCGRERREILVDHDPEVEDPNLVPGTKLTLSRLYAPLLSADKLLGVITIQSFLPHAYGAREQMIFRNLCAYAAIALANAGAQAQLVQQEKLASLGSLVASFAHQLNTPIAAVKSSGKSIVHSLAYTLEYLLPLFQRLSVVEQNLFITLMGNCQRTRPVLSTREERRLVRQLIPQLEAASVSRAQQKAGILVQLGAQLQVPQLLPLLCHAACDQILAVAWHFSSIASNIGNVNLAAERVATIVAALKSFSGIEHTGEKVAIDLQDGLEWALAQCQGQMQNKVVLLRDYSDIPALVCVPDQIRQIWVNLIHNALQAMQHQGTLSIRIDSQGTHAVVAIEDTGPGIPEAIRGRIFDAFFTTKTGGEGSGLGLAIAKVIVEKHQGRIELESVEGKGTRFAVFLPYQDS